MGDSDAWYQQITAHVAEDAGQIDYARAEWWTLRAHDGACWRRCYAQWRQRFAASGRRGDAERAACAAMLAVVTARTVAAVRAGRWPLLQPQQQTLLYAPRALLDKACEETWTFADSSRLPAPPAPAPRAQGPAVDVFVGDTMDVGALLVAQGFRPLCLSMANDAEPGGRYCFGGAGQEESLMRRSNYWAAIDPRMGRPGPGARYPLPEFGGALTRSVLVMRGSEAEGYAFLAAPYTLDFVAVGAYRLGPAQAQQLAQDPQMQQSFAARAIEKIRFILRAAASHGNDSVVLGALGCGANGNPPPLVASLFRQAIMEHAAYFRRVSFALFDDGRPDGVVPTFSRVLNVAPVVVQLQDVVSARQTACQATGVAAALNFVALPPQQPAAAAAAWHGNTTSAATPQQPAAAWHGTTTAATQQQMPSFSATASPRGPLGLEEQGKMLWDASLSGDAARVTQLLQSCDKRAINWQHAPELCTPLWVASHHGSGAIVDALLKAGADKDLADCTGATPLYIACERGNVNAAEVLLFAGADLERGLTADGATPLYIACENGHSACVRALLQAGADKDKGLISDGATPLWIASKNGFREVVEILLAAGADKNKSTSENKSPLFAAICDGKMDVAEILARAGGTIDPRWRAEAEKLVGREKLQALLSAKLQSPRPRLPLPTDAATVEEVCAWLESLGLGEHADRFREDAINGAALHCLTENDIKDLGVRSLGHKRILLNALGHGSPTTTVVLPPAAAPLPPATVPLPLQVSPLPSEASTLAAVSQTAGQLVGFKTVHTADSKPDPDADFLAKSSRVSNWLEMPINTSTTKLNFGLSTRQAPIDQELTESISLSNPNAPGRKGTVNFRIIPNPSGKYSVSLSPNSGKIALGKAVKIDIKLTVLCTSSQIHFEIFVVAWKNNPDVRTCASLKTDIESQLSTKLDSDELEIFTPAIGDGSFGTVFRGRYRSLDVAIKLLKHQEALTPEMMNDFKGEVSMMERLRHPCIISFIGAVHQPGRLSIITEFCLFGSLNCAMKKHKFSLPLKIKALLDTARGLDFLHISSIMHRDLKPDNSLVVSLEVGSSAVCKLSDFGTTRDTNRFAVNLHATKGVGTPVFMAPEILSGMPYTNSADVYSFGLMMANVGNERVPFEDDPEINSMLALERKVASGARPSWVVELPNSFKELAARCWSAKPEERPVFSDIVDALKKMLQDAVAGH